MTSAEAWDLILKALGLFGGGAALTIVVAGFVSKIMADRSIENHKAQLGQETERLKSELAKETETHKLKMKKQEILYNKQLDAASALVDLRMKMEPRVSHPMIEWEEACEQVADKLGPYEEWLRTYISRHGAVLSKDVRKMLDACSSLAALNKFNIQGEDVSREQSRAAGELLDTMEKCEKVFLEEVQS